MFYKLFRLVHIHECDRHQKLLQRPFSERWKLLEKEVIEPRNFDRRQNPIYRYDLEPFRVYFFELHITTLSGNYSALIFSIHLQYLSG